MVKDHRKRSKTEKAKILAMNMGKNKRNKQKIVTFEIFS